MEIDTIVQQLGGWPEYFGSAEIKHGEGLLGLLERDRLIDEIAFGIVCRYAVHRAAFDRLSWEIAEANAAQEFADGGSFLSPAEQTRAYHENKLTQIEKNLLGTPYERARQGLALQTSFMDMLDTPPDGGAKGKGQVVPMTNWRPLSRGAARE